MKEGNPHRDPAPRPGAAGAPGSGRPGWPEFWSDPADAAAAPPEATQPVNGSAGHEPEPESEHEPATAPAPAATAPAAGAEPNPAPAATAEPPRAAAAPAAPAAGSATTRQRTIGPVEAFVRHPILTLLPVLLLAAAAVYVGLDRSPVYTAKARISVGRTDVPPFVLQNVVGGNQALAASYARVISAAPVSIAAGRATGRSPVDARDHLNATPIPGSTLIQVEATGSKERQSTALANAGARALITYIASANRDRKSGGALRRFRAAQAEAQRLQRRLTKLQSKGPKNQRAAARVQVDLDAAQLRASNLANQYRSSTGSADGGSPLTLIGPAASASSDRKTTLERLILIAVAAGIVLGLGLALLVSNRGRLRAMRE